MKRVQLDPFFMFTPDGGDLNVPRGTNFYNNYTFIPYPVY
jgi:hypothetical protein